VGGGFAVGGLAVGPARTGARHDAGVIELCTDESAGVVAGVARRRRRRVIDVLDDVVARVARTGGVARCAVARRAPEYPGDVARLAALRAVRAPEVGTPGGGIGDAEACRLCGVVFALSEGRGL